MGRLVKPKYRIEFFGGSHYVTNAAWRSDGHGKPTDKGLAAYMKAHEESLKPGGANAHLNTVGYRPPTSARVVRQSDGVIVARFGPDFPGIRKDQL